MIDYDDARKRIVFAFCEGVLRQYGSRRFVTQKRVVERPGATYFDKDEVWTDPKGKTIRGRFKRKPSRKVETEVKIPQGVVAGEILDYADAVADAFLETLRIAEEAGLMVPSSELERRAEVD